MKDITEVLKSESLEEIQAEIQERKDLRNQMVGNLYPAVITDEIQKLNFRCSEIQKNHSNKVAEIEKIAWQIFQSSIGITFRRELTPDEKKQVTDVESYAFYREKAQKVYEKRQRALMLNKKYPVIEIPADGKRNWSGGAYCLCFVYSKYNGNFVLKGYMREVEEYLKKNYKHYFYNMSLWHFGQSRDIWRFWKKEIAIFDVSVKDRKKGKKTEVRPWREFEPDDAILEAKTLRFRRLPKRWIKEFDNL